MGYVKNLYIDGLKRFEHFEIEFNECLSILVGENEAGKSTILEAIRIVLNQQYCNADKSVLQDLFNLENVGIFKNIPSVDTLPKIIIEVDLELDNTPRSIDFYGENHINGNRGEEKYGIRFECKFDEDFSEELAESINDGKIPYEYYSLTWQTYANLPYKMAKRPIKNLFIDTSETSKSSAFNFFNRSLFSNIYSNDTKLKAKNAFREKLNTSFEDVNLPDIDTRRRFGIDNKKVVLESILSVYEDSIPLENKGSGMESLVKTQIALNREDNIDTILIEEPENHLCFTNLKQMLQQIMDHEEDSQIILTTHSNMIASRLNLGNVIWISENRFLSLKNVDSQTSAFFEKADDNGCLQLLLSKKVILVEGATEYLLLPKFYEKKTGRTIEKDGISIISCDGISYKRYLEIASKTDKRIAVITDNDHDQTKIDDASKFNQRNEKQHIFMGTTIDDWTWEACVYNCNKEKLDDMIPVQKDAKYLFHKKDYGQVLGKMLANKVDTAYQMLISEREFNIPLYVEEAIEWLNK
ncbi:Predicted ATP-dependent endonuclease of the OLD family, contains P-loop ATPase and TOPRIM domains [Eubacterium uniforme]|uniref:Predicted ATP-dependent endonuclease of the OLD family, contains P-loop ATPase and TOPRIM domains n=1 Tax=Eubacterium uniforme TaxID=39495 RepID=A0A1T4VKM4_9FIRM|nr:TOPRIM nucleotidyl transferase/hydrolase domain-containing protein [Eubacterium uniforme]SKA65418.1 Predicted ATP-dependent endonuclease of the OLD family, contains P-loop ATPase and TOPRIM domains [Eubacterium uniforme]